MIVWVLERYGNLYGIFSSSDYAFRYAKSIGLTDYAIDEYQVDGPVHLLKYDGGQRNE